MVDIERALIAYHLGRGDHKVTISDKMVACVGTVYLVRFYNSFGSCYSSIDAVDDTGVVTEIDRRHRFDERKMLDFVMGRKTHETDR